MDQLPIERRAVLAACGGLLAGCTGLGAQGTPASGTRGGVKNTDIRFTDIAAADDSAFTFRRARNEEAVAELDALKEKGTVTMAELN
ncbi:MAG: hypothetical protein ABEJ05_05710, partial [Haloglomus sp.]